MLKVDGITETASALSTISETLDFPFTRELLSSFFLRSLSSLSRDLLLSVLLALLAEALLLEGLGHG